MEGEYEKVLRQDSCKISSQLHNELKKQKKENKTKAKETKRSIR
ncbi:MAG: hypothetical protein QXY90_00760 [Candidatus Anstonellales archaeon]